MSNELPPACSHTWVAHTALCGRYEYEDCKQRDIWLILNRRDWLDYLSDAQVARAYERILTYDPSIS